MCSFMFPKKWVAKRLHSSAVALFPLCLTPPSATTEIAPSRMTCLGGHLEATIVQSIYMICGSVGPV